MTTPSETVRESSIDSRGSEPAAMSATRPLYWSVRRELFENRSIYIAPLVVAAVVLLGSSISLIGLAARIQALATPDGAEQHALVVGPFSMAPAAIMAAMWLVGIFYSLDALYGERRDRSLLFWKSLPVSDLTTVLSKASIPIVVLPLIAFALSVATFGALLVMGTAVLAANGVSPARLWAEIRVFQQPVVMFYGLAAHALWFAPIYCWLLLVSAWARRTPLLWAALPLLAVGALEKLAFGTSHFAALLKYRLTGAMLEGFTVDPAEQAIDQLSQLTALRLASAPGLWIGLAVAAAFLAAAVRLRRKSEPI